MSYRYLVQEITYNDMNYVVIYHWNHLHGFDCQANIEKLEHWNLFIFCYINKNALAYLQAPNIRNNQGSILESFQAFISVQAAEVVLPKSDLKEKFITFFSTVTKPSNSFDILSKYTTRFDLSFKWTYRFRLNGIAVKE